MFKSALDVIKQGTGRKGAGGFKADPAKAHGLFFATHTTGSARYPFVFFRIGKELARKAGLALGDTALFTWEETTGKGEIKPHPNGWKLVSGNTKSDDPPLILRVTWREGFPSTATPGMCEEVIARSHSITFKYPKGTSFDELAKKAEPKEEEEGEPVDEVYEEHRRIVEREEKINKKAVKPEFRRSTDKAPEMRNNKPYGRRASDKKSERKSARRS